MPSYSSPEDEFRALMSGDHPRLRRNRRLLARLPSDPRCKTCNAPFGFPGSIVSRAIGRPRFPKSPRFCQMCFNWLTAAGIRGADIEMTMLFTDVRNSVGLAERLGPAAYTALIYRYYHVASNAVIMVDGIGGSIHRRRCPRPIHPWHDRTRPHRRGRGCRAGDRRGDGAPLGAMDRGWRRDPSRYRLPWRRRRQGPAT